MLKIVVQGRSKRAAPKSKRGRLRAEYILSERTPLQDKLCKTFDVYKLTNN
jgi:hypothetical protein